MINKRSIGGSFYTLIFILSSISLGTLSFSQNAPCGNVYGSVNDEANIVQQMRYGSIADAVNAINQAKNTRGSDLGCPETIYTRTTANTTPSNLTTVLNVWQANHLPYLLTYNVTCPRIARYESNAALGAYYAMQAGYFPDTLELIKFANMMYNQQYTSWNITNPIPRNEGVFAYLHTNASNPCYPGGVVGSSVTQVCQNLPNYCVNYISGDFQGMEFLTADQDDLNQWFDGGLAYDHGWGTIHMIEAALLQKDTVLKEKYRNSVVEACKFAKSEHCVKNHNYTAKLIWILAEMYAWTGDTIYKNELNYKLNKNLLPGILWDNNNDGFVDDTSPLISFASLNSNAQTPGRMWDGHNSISWYQAMNTWALIEAYVAFRDRGELIRANELKPYALAMLNNLANEIINEGVPAQDMFGIRDMAYALLIGIWKVNRYENLNQTNWEDAAWALWNTGYFDTYSTHSVCVGLYLNLTANTSYTPLHLRENFQLSTETPQNSSFKIFPNPVQNRLYIQSDLSKNGNFQFLITNSVGTLISKGSLDDNLTEVALVSVPNGMYFLTITNNEGTSFFHKFIVYN